LRKGTFDGSTVTYPLNTATSPISLTDPGGRHTPEERGGRAYLVAHRGKIGDLLYELEELHRADDRVGNGGDQVLLSRLRAKDSAVE